MPKWALLVAAAVSFTVGGVCMKYSDGLTRPVPSVLLLLLFMAGASLQALAMKQSEMGAAYLFVLGLESILAFLLSVLLLGESVSMARIGSVLLIAAGMVLLHS